MGVSLEILIYKAGRPLLLPRGSPPSATKLGPVLSFGFEDSPKGVEYGTKSQKGDTGVWQADLD
jgi:hypothetical protein